LGSHRYNGSVTHAYREREREREIGVETRMEGMRDTAGKGETKKVAWHRKCSVAGKSTHYTM